MDSLPIAILDLFALSWFVLCWLAYSFWENKKPGLAHDVNLRREQWAQNMLLRDNRILDIQAITALIRNVTFFASTSILILAGLVAVLGAYEDVAKMFAYLPFAQDINPETMALKTFTLMAIFVFAFFKFGWSIKQHSISAVILAAIPNPEDANTPEVRMDALRMARLSGLGAKHFNDGIRGFYFALAALSWFINAWVLMVAVVWVVVVLYRREYHSHAHYLLACESIK